MNKQLIAKRSDSIIERIRPQVINLLFSTNLSYTEIGNIVGCSRGPVCKIYKERKLKGMSRSNIKIKHIGLCKWCNKETILAKSKTRPNRGKFCSKECYTFWQKSEENRGENNPAWIDGGKHESELNRLRRTDEWAEWRKQVFERDNYTCQLCGERGLELHPHHILQKCDYPDLIFEVCNGITLCKDCHRSKGVHSYKSIFVGLFRMLVNKNYEAAMMHR